MVLVYGPLKGDRYIPLIYPVNPKGPILQNPLKKTRDHSKGPYYTQEQPRVKEGTLVGLNALIKEPNLTQKRIGIRAYSSPSPKP